jgi:hypothetical protein
LICERESGACPLYSDKREILYFDWRHWTAAAERQVGEALDASGAIEELFSLS